jgi:hypothetical protein
MKVIQPLAMSDDERAGMCDLVLYGPFGADNEPLLEPFDPKPGMQYSSTWRMADYNS